MNVLHSIHYMVYLYVYKIQKESKSKPITLIILADFSSLVNTFKIILLIHKLKNVKCEM